jgi:hypothetical protein
MDSLFLQFTALWVSSNIIHKLYKNSLKYMHSTPDYPGAD